MINRLKIKKKKKKLFDILTDVMFPIENKYNTRFVDKPAKPLHK